MNKIISKINILIVAILIVVPSMASAFVFETETLSATSITKTSATINGTVSFEDGTSTVWFEYGSTSLNKTTDAIETSSGNNVKVSERLTGLNAGTTYAYRTCFRVSSLYGLTCGQTKTFTTVADVIAPVVTASTTTTTSSNSSSTTTSSNSSSTSSSSNSNSSASSVKNDTKSNSQSASVANASVGGNFLPNTFLEWIVTIALIFFIVMFGRYLYLKRQEEKEEEKRKEIEMQLRGQMA